jgi:Domain of unknown function (DUF4181)
VVKRRKEEALLLPSFEWKAQEDRLDDQNYFRYPDCRWRFLQCFPASIRKSLVLGTYILLIFLVILSETVRAVMEKRYAENRNDYKFTISQLAFLSFSLLLIFSTDFFGVFE